MYRARGYELIEHREIGRTKPIAPFSEATPQKLCENTIEYYMIKFLFNAIEWAHAINMTIHFKNMVTRREPTLNKLPHKNLNPKRESSFLNLR